MYLVISHHRFVLLSSFTLTVQAVCTIYSMQGTFITINNIPVATVVAVAAAVITTLFLFVEIFTETMFFVKLLV